MAAREHGFTATEIKAGALVLSSLVVLVVLIAAIKGLQLGDQSAKRYYASFTNIGGLNIGADVRFGGVKAGRVVAIATDPDDRSRIRITADVRGEVPVNTASFVSIDQVTLTAEKHLEITTGDKDAELHADGDVLVSRPAPGLINLPDISGVTTRIEALLDDLTTVVGVRANPTGVGEGGSNVVVLTQVLADVHVVLDEAAGTLSGLRGMVGENRQAVADVLARMVTLEESAKEVVEQLNAVLGENRQPLQSSVANLQELTGNLGLRLDELALGLTSVLERFDDFSSNAADLLDDERPAIDDILFDLRTTVRNLREFSQAIAEHPDALVFGQKPQGREATQER